jgi:predicted lipoprotein
MFRPAALLLACLAVMAMPARAQDRAAVVTALTRDVAVPAVEGFAQATDAFVATAANACADPAAVDTARLQAGFGEVADAWARLEPLAFGPLIADNRIFKVNFWPDGHGVAARQLRQYLATADVAAAAAERLAGASVAVQGLPALEALLFDAADGLDEGSEAADFRCAFVEGLAGNLDSMAEAIAAEWTAEPDGYAMALTGAAADPALRVRTDDALLLYFRAASGALGRILQLKLEKPLGADIDSADGRLVEQAGSGRSAAAILGNLVTVEALLVGADGPGLVDAAGLFGSADGLRERLVTARAALEGLAVPLSEAVADPDGRSRVQVARFALEDVQRVVDGRVGAAFGLGVSFNAADGD